MSLYLNVVSLSLCVSVCLSIFLSALVPNLVLSIFSKQLVYFEIATLLIKVIQV